MVIIFFRFSQEVKQEMKQLYEVQLNEKKKELDKLEQKLRVAETKLQNMVKQSEASVKEVNGKAAGENCFESSGIQGDVAVHAVEAEADIDAPQIPVRPASTWRSSIVHTGNTPVQAKRSEVTQRLSNDDYDIVSCCQEIIFHAKISQHNDVFIYCLSVRFHAAS